MHRIKSGIILFAAFLVGCVASRVAYLVVPPARAGTFPQRWEYYCFNGGGPEELTSLMNKFGQQGWELAGTNSHWSTWCFKRPL
jgi:hypothetical protein